MDSLWIVHTVLWLLAPTPSASISSFEERARAEREEMLDLMKQRIEEANRPKAKSPEMESSERERDQTKSALSQKQAELSKQQETANSVQQQQQPVESEVQQEQVFTDKIVCKQENSFNCY